MMDGITEEEVLTDLADIDSENLPKPDNLIEKVAYLQLISDAYPDKIDLYWLGYQLLQKTIYQFTKDQETVVQGLMQRYKNHYRKVKSMKYPVFQLCSRLYKPILITRDEF